jgi:hypothetical protein
MLDVLLDLLLDVLDVLNGADVLDTLFEDEDCFLLTDLSCR